MDVKLAKGMLKTIAYSQGRNKVSGRTVKDVTITIDDLTDIYARQEGKCYWSGLPLDAEYNKIKHHPFAISPERLNNAEPYTKENVVLCRRIFNLGRMDFPQDSFFEVMEQLKEEFSTKG